MLFRSVGTTTTTQKLNIYGSDGSNNVASFTRSGGATMYTYVDTGNNVGIFSGSNASGGGFYANSGDSSARIMAGSAERARIDSSGNLLVGTTNTSPSAGTGLKLLIGADGANTAKYSVVTAATTNSTYSYMHYSTGASAYRMYVGDGGTIYATSTTITAISDQRLKENIRDLDDGLNKVMALKPRKFDWKQGKGKDKKDDRGWIAQEFEQVFPDMIDQWVDPAPEGEEPYKAVNADLIPTLVKAIQEQQAIIEQLKADVAALKGA